MELNYKILGEGTPLVILHGLFGMLDNWQSLGKKFAEHGYMVYLIDQRDHGKSPFTNEFNYTILANDLVEFLESNWIYKAHIIGHSMGGKTAMQFAFEHENFVDKMVIVDVMNKAYKGGHEVIFQAIEELDVAMAENRDIVYEHLKSYNLDEGTVQFLLKNLQRKKEGGYEWKMNIPLLKKAYPYIIDKVGQDGQITEIETLFIRGGKSNYILESEFEYVKKQFPHSQITTIEDAGHWVHADKPKELFNEIIGFLES